MTDVVQYPIATLANRPLLPLIRNPKETFTFDESILIQGLYDYITTSLSDSYMKEADKTAGLLEESLERTIKGKRRSYVSAMLNESTSVLF